MQEKSPKLFPNACMSAPPRCANGRAHGKAWLIVKSTNATHGWPLLCRMRSFAKQASYVFQDRWTEEELQQFSDLLFRLVAGTPANLT